MPSGWWFIVTRVAAEGSTWEEERSLVRRRLRDVVRRMGEDEGAWTELIAERDGKTFYVYQTRSREIRDAYQRECDAARRQSRPFSGSP